MLPSRDRPKVRTLDGFEITCAGTKVPVHVRIDRRAQRLILRVDSQGNVRVTCPSERHVDAALDLARRRGDWIAGRLAEMPPPRRFCIGSRLPFLGRDRVVINDPLAGHMARLEEDAILVTGDENEVSRRIERLVRDEVRDICDRRSRAYAGRLGVRVGTVRVRNMRTRWGSCAANGNLTFNFRLGFAPLEVLDYVVLHEVAHRRYMDHSRRFWAVVRSEDPGFERHEEWLRREGRTLFAYGAD